MAYDFKKEEKYLYQAKKKTEIVTVPSLNYLSVRGKGNPNEIDGEYSQAISKLYAIAYALRMSYKGEYKIEGYFEYVVPPLEGFWWQEGIKGVDYNKKDLFCWISMIRLPDFITPKDLEWAKEVVYKKKKIDCSNVEFYTVEEGLCAQILHIGAYDNEPETVENMNDFLEKNGYAPDLSDERKHHEIYLSDPRKVTSDKLKTIIRHPIKKII